MKNISISITRTVSDAIVPGSGVAQWLGRGGVKMTTESSTYMCALCVTINQPDTESNPGRNPNPTAKQHAIRRCEHSTKYSRMSYVCR